MKKLLTILTILYFIPLSATPITDFVHAIKETTLTNRLFPLTSFEGYEHNQSKKRKKENFEKVIPFYLKAKYIFSVDTLKKQRESKIHTQNALVYNDFFTTLYPYLEYLKKHPTQENQKLLGKLRDKALEDTTQLMKNSQTLLDYFISISQLKHLYKGIDEKKLIKKYPLEPKETLFTRLIQEKKASLQLIKTTTQSDFVTSDGKKFSKDIVKEYFKITEKKLDLLYNKAISTIKDGSTEAIEGFRRYHSQLQETNSTNLSEIASCNAIALSIVRIEPILEFYKEHQLLLKRYNRE